MRNIIRIHAFVLLFSMLYMTANAARYTVNYTLTDYDLNINGSIIYATGEKADNVTMQIMKMDRTDVIYAEQVKPLASSPSPSPAVNVYSFNFPTIKFSDDTPTGNYILRVGGTGTPSEQTITFINRVDKINALNAVKNAQSDSSSLTAVITAQAVNLGIDASRYNEIPTFWHEKVNEVIAGLTLDTLTVSDTNDKISANLTLFQKTLNKAMHAALICTTKTPAVLISLFNEVTAVTIANDTRVKIDKTYFLQVIDPSLLAARFAKHSFDSNGFLSDRANDYNAVTSEFDKAVLLTCMTALPKAKMLDLLNYYNANGNQTINPKIDFAVYNTLNIYNQDLAIQQLRDSNIDDVANISSVFNEVCRKLATGDNPVPRGGASYSIKSSELNATPTTVEENKQTTVKTEFVDISDVKWAKESIDNLSKRGVIIGDGNGNFRPNDTVSRQEFIKMIVVAFNLLNKSAKADFADVKENSWYYTYVASAKNAGIIRGVNADEFGVDSVITRQDMAVILNRIFSMAEIKNSNESSASYSDINQISTYAQAAVAELSKAGILQGYGNTFNPFGNVTRAQSSKAIYGILKLMEGK